MPTYLCKIKHKTFKLPTIELYMQKVLPPPSRFSGFGRAYEGLAAQSRQRIFSLKKETSKMAA